jgi:hypothetical protein
MRSSTAPLTAPAAAGRDPTDITHPTVGGQPAGSDAVLIPSGTAGPAAMSISTPTPGRPAK